jgi:hypothetical protein
MGEEKPPTKSFLIDSCSNRSPLSVPDEQGDFEQKKRRRGRGKGKIVSSVKDETEKKIIKEGFP